MELPAVARLFAGVLLSGAGVGILIMGGYLILSTLGPLPK